MDDILKQIEESLSCVGSDETWTREVFGRDVIFAPISFTGQAKVQEALASSEQNVNFVNDTKRVTMSHAIVGIDNLNLIEFRDAGSIFGPIKVKGQDMKVGLAAYIHHKMASWGQEFIDTAFAIYADEVETRNKKNLEGVVFQNVKSPEEELADLMVRVTELRYLLKMPPLVEAGPEDEVDDTPKGREDPEEEPADEDDGKEEVDNDFDPFKSVRVPPTPRPAPIPRPASMPEADHEVPSIPTSGMVPQQEVPSHLPTRLQAQKSRAPINLPSTPPATLQRATQIAELEGDLPFSPNSSPSSPFVTSHHDEVIEAPASRERVAPPIIDKLQKPSLNPRFQAPKKLCPINKTTRRSKSLVVGSR